ncbi:MAG TPA: hypothetical protein VI248_20040 [Kineosporiaceae bacterium]
MRGAGRGAKAAKEHQLVGLIYVIIGLVVAWQHGSITVPADLPTDTTVPWWGNRTPHHEFS